MTPAEARALIAHPSIGSDAPQVWADLGCGRGTFTVALAALLPDGSTIHAVDTNRDALARLPRISGRVRLVPHVADFTTGDWQTCRLDGVLMANSLHYVRDQDALLTQLVAAMEEPRVVLVEYDTDQANRWVPFPLSRQTAARRFAAAGLAAVIDLGRRPSVYQRSDLYAVLATR